MLGMLGTVILALGVTVISLVFIFGFKPTEFISDFLYDRQEKKNKVIDKLLEFFNKFFSISNDRF